MRVAFHQISPIAKRALWELQQKKPDFSSAARLAERHYGDASLLHAAACFLLYDDLGQCVARIAADRGIEDYMARDILCRALGHAPQMWQADADYFHLKGFTKAQGRYYIAPEGLGKNSGFESERRKLPLAAKRVMDKGIGFLLSGKGLPYRESSLSLILIYMVILLRPEGREKDFRLMWLSMDAGAVRDRHYKVRAAQLICRFAKECSVPISSLGIVLPKELLTGLRMKKETRHRRKGSHSDFYQCGAVRPQKRAANSMAGIDKAQ